MQQLAPGTGLSAAVGGRSSREPPPEARLYDPCQGAQEVCLELVDTSAHVQSCPPGWYSNLSIFTVGECAHSQARSKFSAELDAGLT